MMMQCMDFIRDKMADKELPRHDDKNNGHFIHGLIIGRRSMGRKLAFADIAITQSAAHTNEPNNTDSSIKIIFTRQSFVGPDNDHDALNEAFPTKMTSLPYSASISAQLGHCQKVPSKSNGVIEDVWEVTRWKITEHPKELAEGMASLLIDNGTQHKVDEQSSKHEKSNNKSVIIGSGAMSCSDYLRARGEAFELANMHKQRVLHSKEGDDETHSINEQTIHREMQPRSNDSSTNAKSELNNIEAEFHHGGKQAKAKRAKIFASWILETFFDIPMTKDSTNHNRSNQHDEFLCQPFQKVKQHTQQIHVFDVAGGKGNLSLELILQQMRLSTSAISRCTIVDPMVRKSDSKQRHAKLKKAASHLHKQNDGRDVATIEHLATCFTKDCFPQIHSQSVSDNSQEENATIPTTTLLLGLHPDQCTEDILDAALQNNLSVAIIPCCVFPYLFPSRTLKRNSNGSNENDGESPVRDYSDFLQYLLDKDESLQLATLPFEGKNKVIYRKVKPV